MGWWGGRQESFIRPAHPRSFLSCPRLICHPAAAPRCAAFGTMTREPCEIAPASAHRISVPRSASYLINLRLLPDKYR